ncbi:glycosyltransferase family 4 protein [Sphingobacterium sp. PU5-4]|uniref:Glycosyltransferase family 4 protein n=1 Tax=Sphingobacterium tenebrionis TaxID=3111775 RepID=A0ABU8I2N0_9SPHI
MNKIIRVSTVPESLYALLKGQLKYLSESFEVVGVSSSGEYLELTSERENIPVIAVDMERRINPIKDIRSLINLYKIFKREKPYIVHSITPKAGLLSMIAAKFAGVPIRIHTFTGVVFPSKTGLFQKILILMDRILCASATHIYPEGNGVRKDLINFNITKKPLKIIANGNVNGIDLNFFDPKLYTSSANMQLKEELGIKENDFVFIFVGRLVRDKGIEELIMAFKEINVVNAKLILVGPYENKIDPLSHLTLKEIKNNQNIIEVGFQKDVRPYFAIADALVFPSYREGFPNVVLQAGAMGIPSIVTDINGSNEIIENGINGIIVPLKDVDKLKKNMTLILDDVNFYKKLKNKSRSMIEEKYQQELVWQTLLKEYIELINSQQNKYS